MRGVEIVSAPHPIYLQRKIMSRNTLQEHRRKRHNPHYADPVANEPCPMLARKLVPLKKGIRRKDRSPS